MKVQVVVILKAMKKFTLRESFLLISENIISEGEIALALGYLIGDTCLYKAACEEPHIATEYLGAAEMLLQTMKLMPQYV